MARKTMSNDFSPISPEPRAPIPYKRNQEDRSPIS